MQLDSAEQMALYAFIWEHWDEFVKTAQGFLTEEEIEKLGEKLSKMS